MQIRPFLAATLVATLGGGCGQSLPFLRQSSANSPSASAVSNSAYALQSVLTPDSSSSGTPNSTKGARLSRRHPLGLGGFWLGKLHLGTDQRQQIRIIFKQHRQSLRQDRPSFRALKPILTAAQVDPAALRAAITERIEWRKAHLAGQVAMYKDILGVLSDSQKAELDTLLAGPSLSGAGQPAPQSTRRAKRKLALGHVLADLHLTTDQQAAVRNLLKHFKAMRQSGGTTIRTAMQTFVRTGETDALVQSLSAGLDAIPVDAIVQVAVSLNQSQRLAILRHFRPMGSRN